MSISVACHPTTSFPLRGMVGNTPLIELGVTLRGKRHRIFAKAEFLNLTGSIKDRMALTILQNARASNALMPGQKIVEMTSGNAGIALAALGSSLGHKVTIFMPEWMSEERRGLLRSFGADIRLVTRADGGFLGALEQSEEYGKAHHAFLTRQFANTDNLRAHSEGTGPELLAQLDVLGLRPDAFVAGVGTGGTVMGVARAFQAAGVRALVHPVEPLESPTLSTGHKIGHHRIQGISDDFIPDILKLEQLAAPLAVSDSCAIRMAQRLGREHGLGVGISSGANLLAAIAASEGLDGDGIVATVFCDNSLRYLTTDLARHEQPRPGSIVDDIQIETIRTLRPISERQRLAA